MKLRESAKLGAQPDAAVEKNNPSRGILLRSVSLVTEASQFNLPSMQSAPLAEALLEDYKLKVQFAVEQTNRMQTQFQVMLTLESLLATTLIVSNSGNLTSGAKWIALLEMGLSAAWAMVGRVGRQRALAHKADFVAAGKKWATAADLGDDYKPVGDGPNVVVVGVLAPLALTIGWSILFLIFAFLA